MQPSKDERLIVALDVPDLDQALEVVESLRECVRFFKVGMELLEEATTGQITEAIHARAAKVFLDRKYHDIPNTVGRAVHSASRRGVDMLNVHCKGSKSMMEKAVIEAEAGSKSVGVARPCLIGVTELTSIDEPTLRGQLRVDMPLPDYVVHLARLAYESGLDGVVASPQELTCLRQTLPPEFILVTPGIRPRWAPAEDQKRFMTPREAIDLGATHIVVGRPILRPPQSIGSPLDAAKKILDEMDNR